jgi:hypothetical protein
VDSRRESPPWRWEPPETARQPPVSSSPQAGSEALAARRAAGAREPKWASARTQWRREHSASTVFSGARTGITTRFHLQRNPWCLCAVQFSGELSGKLATAYVNMQPKLQRSKASFAQARSVRIRPAAWTNLFRLTVYLLVRWEEGSGGDPRLDGAGSYGSSLRVSPIHASSTGQLKHSVPLPSPVGRRNKKLWCSE